MHVSDDDVRFCAKEYKKEYGTVFSLYSMNITGFNVASSASQ